MAKKLPKAHGTIEIMENNYNPLLIQNRKKHKDAVKIVKTFLFAIFNNRILKESVAFTYVQLPLGKV